MTVPGSMPQKICPGPGSVFRVASLGKPARRRPEQLTPDDANPQDFEFSALHLSLPGMVLELSQSFRGLWKGGYSPVTASWFILLLPSAREG